jgi:hypothetical protein
MDFAFGGGILYDLVTQESGNGFRASLDGQILWIKSSEGSNNADMMESQLAFIGSIRSSGTNAYTGIATSFINAGGDLDGNESGQTHVLFGVDYFMDYNFYFNAEAHLFGQDLLSIGVGYQF